MPEDEKTVCSSCGAEALEFLDCEECGMALCRDCVVEVTGRNLCYRCKGQVVHEMDEGGGVPPSRRFRAKGIRPHTLFLLSLMVFIAFFAAVYPAMVIGVMMVYFVLVFIGSIAVLVSNRIKKVFFVNDVWIDRDSIYGMTGALTLVRLRWREVADIDFAAGRIAISGDRRMIIKGRFEEFEEMNKLISEIAAAKNIKITEGVTLDINETETG